jgi:hypothetical protein
MLAALVGLSMLLAVVGGTATLAACLLARRLRARQAQRHPQQAAAKERTRQARRLAAEWAPARPDPGPWLPGSVDPPAPLPGCRVCR